MNDIWERGDFISWINPLLIDDSPVRLEGSQYEPVGIPQLSVDNKGEYLYWCYIADEESEGEHKSGIKRIKLGEERPLVETVIEGVEGYGVVAVNYSGPVQGSVESIDTEVSADAPVEYYNLQGIRIHTPQPGTIVIRRQGTRTTKRRY